MFGLCGSFGIKASDNDLNKSYSNKKDFTQKKLTINRDTVFGKEYIKSEEIHISQYSTKQIEISFDKLATNLINKKSEAPDAPVPLSHKIVDLVGDVITGNKTQEPKENKKSKEKDDAVAAKQNITFGTTEVDKDFFNTSPEKMAAINYALKSGEVPNDEFWDNIPGAIHEFHGDL